METDNNVIYKDIAIYGAGGLGRETAVLIKEINDVCSDSWHLIGFFDDGKEIGTQISHWGKVIGGMTELNNWPDDLAVIIAVGDPKARKAIAEKVVNPKIDWPNLIHPQTWFGDKQTITFGRGNLVHRNCRYTTDIHIGNFNLFNGSIVCGHDVTINDYNAIMPGVRISGEAKIGDCNLLGVNAIILQQLHIGNNTNIGAGAVLLTNPKENSTYLGNPAKIFKF